MKFLYFFQKEKKPMSEVEGIFPIVCFLAILVFLNMGVVVMLGGKEVLPPLLNNLFGVGIIVCTIGVLVSMGIYLLHFANWMKEKRGRADSG